MPANMVFRIVERRRTCRQCRAACRRTSFSALPNAAAHVGETHAPRARTSSAMQATLSPRRRRPRGNRRWSKLRLPLRRRRAFDTTRGEGGCVRGLDRPSCWKRAFDTTPTSPRARPPGQVAGRTGWGWPAARWTDTPTRNAIGLSSPVGVRVERCDRRSKPVAFQPPPSYVTKALPSSQGEGTRAPLRGWTECRDNPPAPGRRRA
jgi:hypothetical protein